jgi:predicted SprT family Zn-dependent metalloprotease
MTTTAGEFRKRKGEHRMPPTVNMEAFRQANAQLDEAPAAFLSMFITQRDLLNPPATSPRFPSDEVLISAGRQRLLEVRNLALSLLAKHGLYNWTFAYNRRKQTMGMCVYDRRTIELSIYFVLRNSWAEILDTILHEIAHALAGSKHGHDGVWKRKCREIGARPERCGEANMPAGPWRAHCGGCGRQFHRYRRPRRRKGWYCGGCGPGRGGLVWRRV